MSAEEKPRQPVHPEQVRVVRAGHGANCSSIGSVIDTLFVTALAGGAVFAAVMAALAEETARTVPSPAPTPPTPLDENEEAAP